MDTSARQIDGRLKAQLDAKVDKLNRCKVLEVINLGE